MNSSYYWYMLLFSQWSLIISNPPPLSPAHTHTHTHAVCVYPWIPIQEYTYKYFMGSLVKHRLLTIFFITKTITHVYNTNDAQTIRANFRVLRSAVSRHLSRANSCKCTIKYTEYPQIRSTSFWSFFITIQTCSFGQMNTKIVFSHWHFFC